MSFILESSSSSSHEYNAHPTFGAMEIGVSISNFLFGIVTIQVYLYFTTFVKDSRWTKLLVAFVWLCELAHTICICHTQYTASITFYGHPEKMVKAPLSLDISLLLSGFIVPAVQAFFALRVFRFSKSYFIPIFCGVLSFARFLGLMAQFAMAIRMTSLVKYAQDTQWLVTATLSIGAVVDLTIAATLVYHFIQQRKNAFTSTVTVIDKLIVWAIETGLVTSLASVAMMICYITMHQNYVWVGLYVFVSRIFSNSLLASLNGRVALRDLLTQDLVQITQRLKECNLDLSALQAASAPVTVTFKFEPVAIGTSTDASDSSLSAV